MNCEFFGNHCVFQEPPRLLENQTLLETISLHWKIKISVKPIFLTESDFQSRNIFSMVYFIVSICFLRSAKFIGVISFIVSHPFLRPAQNMNLPEKVQSQAKRFIQFPFHFQRELHTFRKNFTLSGSRGLIAIDSYPSNCCEMNSFTCSTVTDLRAW
jgi:hypothetical protein